MVIMVIGKGGREHALVHALALEKNRVYVVPGNPGMAEQAECLDLPLEAPTLADFCHQNQVDLVVIGPEDPLVDGLADGLRQHGVKVFGPGAEAAQLEGSKLYAKNFMERHRVPTAASQVVESLEEVCAHGKTFQPPYVLKAEGLAAGKGVFICESFDELKVAADQIFNQKTLGSAGSRALLEEFQEGYELSFFVLTNGKDYQALPMAQDHKKLKNHGEGPNTGGMGTVAPMSLDERLYQRIIAEVVEPTLKGLQEDKLDYRGVIFIGLMVTSRGPQVLEYNVRFGDPETQVLLPLLKGSWSEALMSIADGSCPKLDWHRNRSVACVVLAAENYPASPVKGVPITGDLSSDESGYFLHAGTSLQAGQLVTHGGRVLNAVAIGANMGEAIKSAYGVSERAHWPGMQKRTDIGANADQKLNS